MFKLGEGLTINIQNRREGVRFGVLGKSGSGKTHTLFVLAEEAMSNGWPVCIIDPMNNFRHLRSLFPVIVAGQRKSADVRLTEDNAPTLAEFFFRQRVSVVIDTSMYAPGEEMEVLKSFLTRLWTLILAQDEDATLPPYAVLIDEAQMYVPQNGQTPVTPVVIDMAKRGRQLMVSMVVASQRSASIQKDFLTQSNVLICHRVMLGNDAALVAEITTQPTKVINQTMRKMQRGQALVIADNDLLDAGEEDYVLGQVRERQVQLDAQADDTAPAQMGRVDAAMLEQMRERWRPSQTTMTMTTRRCARRTRG